MSMGRTAVRPAARSPSPALRERGTQGVRATQRACPFTLARGKSPPPQRFCAEPMYPYQLCPLARKRRGDLWSAEAELPPDAKDAQRV